MTGAAQLPVQGVLPGLVHKLAQWRQHAVRLQQQQQAAWQAPCHPQIAPAAAQVWALANRTIAIQILEGLAAEREATVQQPTPTPSAHLEGGDDVLD
jgi:hypothetical protein